VQVGAADGDIPCTEQPRQPLHPPGRQLGALLRAEDDALYRRADRLHFLGQAELLQDAHRVRPDDDPPADLDPPDRAGAFEDHRLDAGPAQRKSCRQSADTRAHHDRAARGAFHTCHRIRFLSP